MVISQEKARENMLNCQLEPNSVHDTKIIHAINSIRREEFVPELYRKNAYIDDDIKIAEGSYILSPVVFGRMLKVASLKQTDKVLDIGCSSGYSSAVISQLCKQVVAVEASTKLIGGARSTIENLGISNVSLVKADLSKGCAASGKYNKIFIHGLVEQIPERVIGQLLPGGVIVTIMKVEEHGSLPFIVTIMLDKKDVLSVKTHYQATAPLLQEFAKPAKFVL